MGTRDLFPGESEVREMAARAVWSPTVGNGWAAVFASPEGENITLGAYASSFKADVTPAFLALDYFDKYVLQDNVVIEMMTGETQEATPLQVAAFRYRNKTFSLWDLSESEATLFAPLAKGW